MVFTTNVQKAKSNSGLLSFSGGKKETTGMKRVNDSNHLFLRKSTAHGRTAVNKTFFQGPSKRQYNLCAQHKDER